MWAALKPLAKVKHRPCGGAGARDPASAAFLPQQGMAVSLVWGTSVRSSSAAG